MSTFEKILDIQTIRRAGHSFVSYDRDEFTSNDLAVFLGGFSSILVIDDKDRCLAAFVRGRFAGYVKTLLVNEQNFGSWAEDAIELLQESPHDGDPLIIVHARVAKSSCPQCGCLGVNDVKFLDKIELISERTPGQLHMLAFDSSEEACPLIMADLASRLAA